MDPEVPDFRLDGRVAIVTGASSGIGRRFSQVLAAQGATVLAAARRADRLDELAASDDRILAAASTWPSTTSDPLVDRAVTDLAASTWWSTTRGPPTR